jgi:hypothetical protein
LSIPEKARRIVFDVTISVKSLAATCGESRFRFCGVGVCLRECSATASVFEESEKMFLWNL